MREIDLRLTLLHAVLSLLFSLRSYSQRVTSCASRLPFKRHADCFYPKCLDHCNSLFFCLNHKLDTAEVSRLNPQTSSYITPAAAVMHGGFLFMFTASCSVCVRKKVKTDITIMWSKPGCGWNFSEFC